MSDWVNTALPIATLVLGSVLTMAGQALRDRRTAGREERARREGFMASNFEVHRSAILEMQEISKDFYQAFLTEKQRRKGEGFYDYFDKRFRRLSDSNASSAFNPLPMQESMEAIRSASSDAQRAEALNEFKQVLESRNRELYEVKEDLDEMRVNMESLFPFWRQFPELVYKLRLCMYRSGSNSVVYSGEAFIQAVFKWNEVYSTGGSLNELAERVRQSHSELDRALANALKFGPYDSYNQR
jgi:hypothetical protein